MMADNADMPIDGIIESITCISSNIITDCLENFQSNLKEEFEDEIKNSNVLKSELINICDSVLQQQKNYKDSIEKRVLENGSYLNTIQKGIKQEKTLENNLLKDISAKEKEMAIFKGKLSTLNKKIESLSNMRNSVQICKLLTNTSFAYKGSNVSGYVTGPKRIECFEFDPEKMSTENMINSLYETLKKASEVKENE